VAAGEIQFICAIGIYLLCPRHQDIQRTRSPTAMVREFARGCNGLQGAVANSKLHLTKTTKIHKFIY